MTQSIHLRLATPPQCAVALHLHAYLRQHPSSIRCAQVQQPSIPPATKQPPAVAPPAPQLNSSPRPDTIPSPASRPAAPPPATRVANGQPPPASPATFDYRAALKAYEGALEAGNESLQLQVAFKTPIINCQPGSHGHQARWKARLCAHTWS